MKTEMIMKYFNVTYKLAKQYEVILKDKQLRQIKTWYEIKKGDGPVSAESEVVLKEILDKGKVLKMYLTKWRIKQTENWEGVKCYRYTY